MRRVIVLLSGIVISVYSQGFAPPVNYGITSDYGIWGQLLT
jgi:hypothetical protein